MSHLLAVDDLYVSYGRITAVRGVSIAIEPGEIVSLIGANGAGKSTFLGAVMGLLRPYAGTITFDGTPLIGLPPERIVRQGVVLVPEGRRIWGTLTVAENLQVATRPRRHGGTQQRLQRILERFPAIAPLMDTPASRLSGGEQQQLAIARALLGRPKLLLLDEPSLGLAPIVVEHVFDELAELRDEGVTILLVEQNALRAVEFADRSFVLRAGEIVLSGGREELLDLPNLAASYLGLST